MVRMARKYITRGGASAKGPIFLQIIECAAIDNLGQW
jgi:hypothetical protein